MPPRIPWKPLAAVGLVLGAAGVIITAKRSTSTPKGMALIGDSYAVGLGSELAKIFSDFRFEGHVGTNTAQWASHAPSCGQCGDWLTAWKPDVVLVSLGVNDGSSPNKTNYQTIVRGLHGIGAHVVWIEPPVAVNVPAVRKVIASLGVQTVPATSVSVAADSRHLHPTTTGYRTWAREIAEAIT